MLKASHKTDSEIQIDIYTAYLYCDHCGQAIERIEQGTALAGMDLQLYIYHKGECCEAIKEKIRQEGGNYWYTTIPLVRCMGAFLNNINVDWADLVRRFCPSDQVAKVKKVMRGRK